MSHIRKIVKYFLFIVIIVVAVCYIRFKHFSITQGDLAPDFETTLIDGSAFKLSSLQGGYVLLDFGGSWCGPCLRDYPKLVALDQRYADRLTIVSVALEKDAKSWDKAIKKFGFLWKHQIVDQNRFVMMSSIARTYGVTEIPAKFLIAPDGKLLGKLSFREIEEVLEKE